MGKVRPDHRPHEFNVDADVIPGITDELVAHLEYLFPPRCQGPTENGNAHQRYAGKVELVETLRAHLTRQAEEHLDAIIGDDAGN